MIHHAFGCTCSAPACVRANRNQRSFDTFLIVVFFGLYLAGLYAVIRSVVSAGLFSPGWRF